MDVVSAHVLVGYSLVDAINRLLEGFSVLIAYSFVDPRLFRGFSRAGPGRVGPGRVGSGDPTRPVRSRTFPDPTELDPRAFESLLPRFAGQVMTSKKPGVFPGELLSITKDLWCFFVAGDPKRKLQLVGFYVRSWCYASSLETLTPLPSISCSLLGLSIVKQKDIIKKLLIVDQMMPSPPPPPSCALYSYYAYCLSKQRALSRSSWSFDQ